MSAFRRAIREMIAHELSEMSSTGSAGGGYDTPKAFGQRHIAHGAKQEPNTMMGKPGPGLTKDELDEQNKLQEAQSRYHALKSDPTANNKQKIGKVLAEINRSLTEMDRLMVMGSRLKTETNTTNDQLWKRTHKHLLRIEGRLVQMLNRIQELKQ